MELTIRNIAQNPSAWEAAGVKLPGYDMAATAAHTRANPVWLHFGAGNIFRGFIAGLQDTLLSAGHSSSGIIAAETFDYEIIEKIYVPHDNLTLMVTLLPDGNTDAKVIASIGEGVKADLSDEACANRLTQIITDPGLQMISFTITEKGYAIRGLDGDFSGIVKSDIENGPAAAKHAMSIVTALLYKRFQAGKYPLAVVSMDNCSHNGEKLRSSILAMAQAWQEKGFVSPEFVAYVSDESQVSFPWSMIDKITPRPAPQVEASLTERGFEGMSPITTARHTFIAPFVNAERPQYLVIEDRFPNGRPALEKAGVYMTDRDTVNKVERMKVTTCLNPLHTALAVYGCMLGYTLIADEMKDPQLTALVSKIGYDEGMKVVTDPGILSPAAFLDEVMNQRLPNPFMPDTPQRIAVDTSQKITVRFGETIKSYYASKDLNVKDLVAIPLALAGWLRYLLGVNDQGEKFELSPDPMIPELQEKLAGVELGKPESVDGKLRSILSNPIIFGMDLYEAGLADKVEGMLKELLAGPGAVRATLVKYLG